MLAFEFFGGFFIQFITSVQIYTYTRFLMKNRIRSKEDQIRKQEADFAKKTHEQALLIVVVYFKKNSLAVKQLN